MMSWSLMRGHVEYLIKVFCRQNMNRVYIPIHTEQHTHQLKGLLFDTICMLPPNKEETHAS